MELLEKTNVSKASKSAVHIRNAVFNGSNVRYKLLISIGNELET